MPHRLGRWTHLLLDALETAPAVGVRRVVEAHLLRPPTIAELSAIRRAAQHLEATGRGERRQVRAVTRTGKVGTYLALVRPEAEVSDAELLAAVADLPSRPRRDDEEAAIRLVRLVGRGATTAGQVLVPAVRPEVAARLEQELAGSLEELSRLRRQLARQGQKHSREAET
jgi:hypothetical protein